MKAQCSADYSCNVTGQQVQFNDLSDPGTGYTIVQRFWDFGDGGSAITQNPEYLYNVYGQYLVSLTVTDLDGCENETSQIINVYSPSFFPIAMPSGTPSV